jgi:ATP-dependent protease ClpP protease subunit
MAKSRPRKTHEIAVIGDVDDWEEDVIKQVLELPPQSACTFYIDSAGGSVYGALTVMTLIRLRKLDATAVVLGECSSATILLFAACQKRLVTRYSTFLFHQMRWQSEKRVGSGEAFRWAKHFDEMEKDIDDLQASLFGKAGDRIKTWIEGGYYVTGRDLAEVGLAEMLPME